MLMDEEVLFKSIGGGNMFIGFSSVSNEILVKRIIKNTSSAAGT